jgi:hypothetical protein
MVGREANKYKTRCNICHSHSRLTSRLASLALYPVEHGMMRPPKERRVVGKTAMRRRKQRESLREEGDFH